MCGCLLFLLFHRAITEPQDLIMAAVDVKGTMKDFCSIPCLSSFKSKAVLTQTTQSACSASKKPCNGNVRKLLQPSRPPCNQSFINLFFFLVLFVILFALFSVVCVYVKSKWILSVPRESKHCYEKLLQLFTVSLNPF